MDYKIISGDGHIDLKWLPHDLFVSNAPAKWKDQAPRVVETEEGSHWFAGAEDLVKGPLGRIADVGLPNRGVSKRYDRMAEFGFYEGGPHPTTPELRLRDQDTDGVDAEVIYGVLGLGMLVKDVGLRRVVYQIYNTWAADFCKANPDRLVALACIPNDDPQAAADELRRAAGLGLRGAELAVTTAVKPIWHRDWDPLWAAGDECSMPIAFHTTGFPVREPSDPQMAKEYHQEYRATFLSTFQLGGAEYLTQIVFSGALERYPGLKFVLGECGVGWIPYVLDRMDLEYDVEYFSRATLPLKPSEYWRRQGHTTFQDEDITTDLVGRVGEDNIIWGSDYPHADGLWPDSLEIIEKDLGHLDEDVRRKITCENAGKLYGLLD